MKACPHCGCKAGLFEMGPVEPYQSARFQAVCLECGACSRECSSKAEAHSAWNLRVRGSGGGHRLEAPQPCACCRGYPAVEQIEDGYWQARCLTTMCESRSVFGRHGTPLAAVRAWNRLVGAAAEMVEIER